jgi:ferredoxin-nitrite reductase
VKQRAEKLVQHLESRFKFTEPLTIRVSGCHHSCAEHTLADIGLLARDGEPAGSGAESYQLFLGGIQDDGVRFAREVASNVPAAELPRVIEGVVESYFAERQEHESFRQFVDRVSQSGASRALARVTGAPEVEGGVGS